MLHVIRQRRGCAGRSPGAGTPRRHRLVALVLLAGLTAGCSGGGDGEATADPPASEPTGSPTASASPGASPSAAGPSAAPTPPRAPRDTPRAREAFARHVVDAWGHTLRTNDAEAVTGLSPRQRPCVGCAELRAELQRREDEGWYVDFPGAQVRAVRVRPGTGRGEHVAVARVDLPASTAYFEDGAVRNDNPRHRGVAFEVSMRHQRDGYVLLAFSVG